MKHLVVGKTKNDVRQGSILGPLLFNIHVYFFTPLKIQTLQVMPMTLQYIQLKKTRLLFTHQEHHQCHFSHGLITTLSKLTMTRVQSFNYLSANITKWSNTLKQFVGNLPTNCLSAFDHFVGLEFKGLSCREPSTTLIDGSSTESNTKGILLRITIVRDWKLNEHVNNLYKKAHAKNLMLFFALRLS